MVLGGTCNDILLSLGPPSVTAGPASWALSSRGRYHLFLVFVVHLPRARRRHFHEFVYRSALLDLHAFEGQLLHVLCVCGGRIIFKGYVNFL